MLKCAEDLVKTSVFNGFQGHHGTLKCSPKGHQNGALGILGAPGTPKKGKNGGKKRESEKRPKKAVFLKKKNLSELSDFFFLMYLDLFNALVLLLFK